MTTNNLPTPAGWVDKEGGVWGARDWRAAGALASQFPTLAPFEPLYRVEDLPALVLRKPTLADVLPGAPETGEGEWVRCLESCGREHPYSVKFPDFYGGGSEVWWCFVPATPTDPDACAKAALTAAAGDLDALRAEGWELVRKEGDR